jgi:hypothetical protein
MRLWENEKSYTVATTKKRAQQLSDRSEKQLKAVIAESTANKGFQRVGRGAEYNACCVLRDNIARDFTFSV